MESVLANVDGVVEKEAYSAAFTGSELELSLNALREAEAEFSSANQTRAEERSLREQSTNKALREECNDAFRLLVTLAQYNAAVKADESCNEFLDKVNVFIENSRSLYKSRVRARAKVTLVNTQTETRDDAA